MKHYKLISFDFDGTICDTSNAIVSALSFIFPNIDHNILLTKLSKGTSLNELLMELNSDIKESNISALISDYRKQYNNESYKYQVPYEHVSQTLQSFIEQGSQCIIVSNKGEAALRQFINQYGLESQFKNIIGERTGIKGKPSIELYELAVKPLFSHIPPHEILHIGDTNADIEFAANIGADCAYLKHGFGNNDEAIKLQPKYVFTNLIELNSYFVKRGIHASL